MKIENQIINPTNKRRRKTGSITHHATCDAAHHDLFDFKGLLLDQAGEIGDSDRIDIQQIFEP